MDERVADTVETEETPTEGSSMEEAIPAEEQSDSHSKGSKDFSPEERAGIIAKAKEVGFEKVADEFGIKARLISYWIQQEKKKAAKPSKQLKQSKQTTAKSKDSKRTLEHIAEDVQTMPTEPVKTVEPLITDEPVKPTGRKMETAKKNEEKQTQRDGQALIIENAILKERIALLNREIEKLRAALTNLM